MTDDGLDPGSYRNAGQEGFATAFVSVLSLLPAVQGTSTIAKRLRIQPQPDSVPGRTPIHGGPIILRDLRKHSTSLLTQEETSSLLRSLTQEQALRLCHRAGDEACRKTYIREEQIDAHVRVLLASIAIPDEAKAWLLQGIAKSREEQRAYHQTVVQEIRTEIKEQELLTDRPYG